MEYSHLGNLVFENAQKFGQKVALRFKNTESNKWEDITWVDLRDKVKQAAYSLIEIGTKENDKVGIFSQNMAEIVEVDLALQAIRLTAVPMYATSSTAQIEYIINDAEIEVIFVGEQYQYDRALEALRNSKTLKKIVAIDKSIDLKGEEAAITYEEFMKKGAESATAPEIFKERMSRRSLDDLATLIYTSGTTGEPKGVMLSHANYAQAIKIHDLRLTNVTDKLTSLCFLPLSHVFERAWLYYCLHKGVEISFNLDPKLIQDTLKEVRPNMMCAVPRFWEKVYSGVNEKIETFPSFLQKLTLHAIKVGEKRNLEYKRFDKPVPALLELRYQFYNKTLFRLLKKVIGIENGMLFPCAGSQLANEVNIFLHSVGINIVVGYGLTESTATVSCYNPYNKNYDIDSVGDIMPEVLVKIGENDEILLKGGTITKGYYKKPKDNEESFIGDWFRTGDAGKITPEGRLIMTERIKELFKTSNGKYIAPQHVENKLVIDKYIEQVAIIGDQRKFVSALIIPAYGAVKAYAEAKNIEYHSMEDLLKNENIINLFWDRIKQCQKDLATYEQVKKFTLLTKPFTSENGELTLTLKLKRKVIYQNYANEIEAMYV
ncbi:MAG TPA: long-chain fatty acid--CoA ligase [Paludibacteraceae bacterium]|nr:long-chain fatty acid--CoA ligase [Paludibacteraceae bacterium]HOU67302.1 long-chain fatty acid--CoA ligase [Paludibacteraceae bacterium]HPH62578.1 long-chain fatty acid--CoA ligase [Paludibacteraceae bacterium]HQF49434.1 long-chain fatty acid--CoA ligase [Paludibacteraceae bacterium]